MQRKYYLTFKLKMVFSVLFLFQNCIMAFATVSIQRHPHQYAYQQGIRHNCCYDILCTALFKALFHVPLLYFEHLPLQRSLHGPVHNNAYMNTMRLFEWYNTNFIQINLLWYTICKIFYLGVFFFLLLRGFFSHATCNHLVYCSTLRTAIKCRGDSYLLAS